ncbi:beta-glucosidase [Rhizobium deserti]|uniref:Beta-glucosidase n=1 Tax=Rhizobium deserti TaxID=2547961 RepID=A0A4R5UI45_9HYPH|nr:beta-glucosidase [Rhizobium deserti]TDK35557.1 beta-glucosidase [Rhizobium deserti]
MSNDMLRSFFLGGFECSSHRRADGVRLDLLRTTTHDVLAGSDYRQLQNCGISTVRDGLRWHLIEVSPGQYDWSSFLPMLRGAAECQTEVIWDLCHYGWPDHLDIWSPEFVSSFSRFAAAAAELIRSETGRSGLYCPVNEMSFWAWAGGDSEKINPCATGRGAELKRQLVRAAIAATDEIRKVDPQARFITAEPLINVSGGSGDQAWQTEAENYRLSQFEATDLLTGCLEPELGGRIDNIDFIGLNFYPDNQWYLGGSTIPLGHHSYRPLSDMLVEAYERYRRPLVISETGAEGSAAPAWMHYVCSEVEDALRRGVPIKGICLYPVLDYPGWENDRTCEVGLLGTPGPGGERQVHHRLLDEMRRYGHLSDLARKAGSFADA